MKSLQASECYLCNTKVEFFIEKNGYKIYFCPKCSLARTDLGQSYEEFVKEHYTKEYFTGSRTHSAYVDYRDDKSLIVKNMQKFLRRIKEVKPQGRLLDIGCAMGFFVDLAKNNGYEAFGFDPSSYAIEEAQKKCGNSVKTNSISSASYPKKYFDIITLFDVFEHLGDPIADIKKVQTWLKDDGILVIATGDTESILAKMIKHRWTFYIPPQHIFFFNRHTMSTVLLRCGLKPYRWFRIGKWLSLRYVLHLAGTTGQSYIGKILSGTIGKTKIGKFPLYLPVQDNMVVIAQKISARNT